MSFLALKCFKTDCNDNMTLYSDEGTLSRHFEYAGARVSAIEAKSETSEEINQNRPFFSKNVVLGSKEGSKSNFDFTNSSRK